MLIINFVFFFTTLVSYSNIQDYYWTWADALVLEHDIAGLGHYQKPSLIQSSDPFNLLWMKTGVTDLIAGDIDRNGLMEVVCHRDGHITILDGKGQKITSFILDQTQEIELNLLKDFNGDGKLELLFGITPASWARRKTLIMYLYDYNGNLLQKFVRNGTDSWIRGLGVQERNST